MSRTLLHAALFVIVLPVFVPRFAVAQQVTAAQQGAAAQLAEEDDIVVERNSPSRQTQAQPATVVRKVLKSGQPVPAGAGYAVLDAPLYPCPKQGIPPQVGMTIITNPALAPHEMLYPHTYRALYPPFYHKTQRCWLMTPFGVIKNERRVLTGTEVCVKYKPCISPFTMFFPPAHY